MPFWYIVKFSVGTYRSEVCLELILCACELDRNWSLFLVTNKSIEYTGCHRRNGPNFGRVFLMLNYTDITQNTYIQS